MGILGGIIRDGSWWVTSETDPRWNCSGRGFVGGLMCPGNAKDEIDRIKEELGEEPPEDLSFGYMKD